MYLLYILLILFVISALSLTAVPFFKNNISILSKPYLSIASIALAFSLCVYFSFGQSKELEHWLTAGQKHYQLAVEVNRLGGIDGIIEKLKQKLATNPTDAKGWVILGKLYYSKQDFSLAKQAFKNAYFLDPDNQEIKQLLQEQSF